jgi:hypothetical protein
MRFDFLTPEVWDWIVAITIGVGGALAARRLRADWLAHRRNDKTKTNK